jgi:hypothetical protein
VAERDLPCEADEEVQADGGYGVDPYDVENVQDISAGNERDDPEKQDQPHENPNSSEIGLKNGQFLFIGLSEIPAGMEP